MDLQFQKDRLIWLHEPKEHNVADGRVIIKTEPETDMWQRTCYGSQVNNAPALLMKTDEKYFSFIVKTEFDSSHSFDQCGVLIYLDSENWIKISTEYENETFQRLGSVVTNHGYSDWATTDIPTEQKHMYYRVSRRESDFLIEHARDGVHFQQMRIAHLFEGAGEIQIGLYACSPDVSSFRAVFTEIAFTECQWRLH
ncbi:DUF1349 domain-containing protein [Butyricicoccus faecihominis]|uniref:DUF1349 domain-containing protein n=1 Tax=Butyricicoccaceae TaxID=3085642 RepID=UPI002479184A|nr:MULTISPECIES: DUF1349 domain-containing protein [Butyricicoccaceae]MCQ5129507.1 DUF1349 domain-containing protein [Butyricicoccus faecihominis]WNX83878.1 DUF1349 domain-containing protein [Agathobaculum sp. NTUH-O15-33]